MLGGTGFIGAHLARRLTDTGHAVTAVDAGHDYGQLAPGARAAITRWRRETLLHDVEVLAADVHDVARVRDLLETRQPVAVVHLANLPLATLSESDGASRAILGTTRAVLHALHGLAARLVYASSSMVYGDFCSEPMPETGATRPRNRYGALKLAAERAARAARPDTVVIRPSAVYGPGDANCRVLDRLRAAAATGAPLAVDDPDTRLDFTWVEDLAEGIARAAVAPEAAGATLNLTRGRARTLREAAQLCGAPLRIGAPAHVRPRRGALDVSRAAALLGFAPRVDLEEGLRRLAATPVPARAVA